ncbi:MAG: hypothetical protein Q8O76_08505 [Chloroflexota bacterium]|nr:hypothetical protein [Chloroflexota bacterium]
MLHNLEKRVGIPPLKDILFLATGPTGKRLSSILQRLEELTKDARSLGQVLELLKLIQEMDKAGTLVRLEAVLKALPKGKQAEALAKTLESLGPRLDKLGALLEAVAEGK